MFIVDRELERLHRAGTPIRVGMVGAGFMARGIAHQMLTAERCESSPPREVEKCPGGPILLASIAVKDRICSIYRDDRVRVQLGFNSRLQLVRLQTDMKPYRMLKSEWLGFELDWGK